MRRKLAPAMVVLLAAVVMTACGDDPAETDSSAAASAEQLEVGADLFRQRCAPCHGTDLRGTSTGPSLLHPYYAPDHHSDEAFYVAVEQGVPPHHWDFGPMPSIPGLDRDEVGAIIAHVRSVQDREGFEE